MSERQPPSASVQAAEELLDLVLAEANEARREDVQARVHATCRLLHDSRLRVDVQPDEARVPSLVDALAAHAARLRAEGALPPPRKAKARRR